MKSIIDNLYQLTLNNSVALKILIPIALFIGALFIIVPTFLINTEVVNERMKKNKNAYLTHFSKRYVQDFLNCKLTVWMDNTFKYSRLYTYGIGKYIRTSVSFFLATLITSFVLGLMSIVIFKSVTMSLLVFIIFFSLSYLGLYILRMKQKAAVSLELMNFLNLLGNYSTANSEIFSIFEQIAPQVSDPLRTCLYEAIYEVQDVNRDKVVAIRNLSNKIEDEKFKEIMKNLEIALNNVSSYGEIVSTNRHSLIEYLHGKKMRASIAKENLISFVAVLVAFIGVLGMLGEILEVNIALTMVNSVLGACVLIIAFLISVYFIASAIRAGK